MSDLVESHARDRRIQRGALVFLLTSGLLLLGALAATFLLPRRESGSSVSIVLPPARPMSSSVTIPIPPRAEPPMPPPIIPADVDAPAPAAAQARAAPSAAPAPARTTSVSRAGPPRATAPRPAAPASAGRAPPDTSAIFADLPPPGATVVSVPLPAMTAPDPDSFDVPLPRAAPKERKASSSVDAAKAEADEARDALRSVRPR